MATQKSEKYIYLDKKRLTYGAAIGTLTGAITGFSSAIALTPADMPVRYSHIPVGALMGLVAGVVIAHCTQDFRGLSNGTPPKPLFSKLSTGNLCLDYMLKGTIYGGLTGVGGCTAFGTGLSIGLGHPLGFVLAAVEAKRVVPTTMTLGCAAGLLLFCTKKAQSSFSSSNTLVPLTNQTDNTEAATSNTPENRC